MRKRAGSLRSAAPPAARRPAAPLQARIRFRRRLLRLLAALLVGLLCFVLHFTFWRFYIHQPVTVAAEDAAARVVDNASGLAAAFLAARLGPEGGDAQLSGLRRWLSDRGGVTNGTALHLFDAGDGGRTVRGLATEAATNTPGARLLSVPFSACLNGATYSGGSAALAAAVAAAAAAEAATASATLKENLEPLETVLPAPLVLLYETLRCTRGAADDAAGVDGDWCPYVASLPRAFPGLPPPFDAPPPHVDTLLAALPLLHPLAAAAAAATRRQAAACGAALPVLLSHAAAAAASASKPPSPGAASWAALPPAARLRVAAWAAGAARTRAFALPSDRFRTDAAAASTLRTFVPWLDLCNHAPSEAATARMAVSDEGVELRATAAGETAADSAPPRRAPVELTYSYWEKPGGGVDADVEAEAEAGAGEEACSAATLASYGFALPTGASPPASDCWGVRMTPAAAAWAAASKRLRNAGLPPAVEHVFSAASPAAPPWLVEWVAAAAGLGGDGEGGNGEANAAARVALAGALAARREALRAAHAASVEAANAGGGGGGEWGEGVRRVAEGALRAAKAAVDAARFPPPNM